MRPILTLTPNPALDLSAGTAQVRPNTKLRCGPTAVEPGGGGVNVSRAVHQLGGASRCLVALGGATGAMLEEGLMARGLDVIRVSAPGDTRQSLAVTCEETGNQFRFSLAGADWSEADCADFLEAVEAAVESGALVVLSGSLPPGMGPEWLKPLADVFAAADATFIVDTSGEPLKRLAAEGGADVLRMDHAEARFLSGTLLADVAEVRAFAATLAKVTPQVIVAMGAAGSVMAGSDGSAWHAAGADVPVVSKVGAGDSFVGGFTLALASGKTSEEALQAGMAAASAAVMTAGTELCRFEDYNRLLPECVLTRL
ncbi:1-phosphofructokinase family hexose kinase [Vannielia litorea]|uniref:1-phosphofructokinase family hexose kinase n=1 Tax=Vannielia litorea TaxID=1217970 RepID=UPI001C94ADEC|nr:1-phosphofructokinase family hexose kinase [Vannielia litorea]MBY6155281.1 1-phosphofructokinase family hexose kinase [Vannielia litorea]